MKLVKRALIVGLGSIGSRHLQNIKSIAPEIAIIVWRQHEKSSPHSSIDSLADNFVFSLGDALSSNPDIALICNPASMHTEAAIALAEQGIHLFIEKPISNTPERLDVLIDLCVQQELVLMVGYNFRFYAPLQILRQAVIDERIGRPLSLRAEAGQYLPHWRPTQDYRNTVSAQACLGGGVTLELSHEIDYLRWIMGEVHAVSAWLGRQSDLEIDVEDTAEMILEFKNRVIGSIHLDMVRQPPTRTCTILGTAGTLEWDITTHQVRLFSAENNQWEDLHPTVDLDRNEMYRLELQHFLDCVREQHTPTITGVDGRRVLEIILAAKKAAQEQQRVVLP